MRSQRLTNYAMMLFCSLYILSLPFLGLMSSSSPDKSAWVKKEIPSSQNKVTKPALSSPETQQNVSGQKNRLSISKSQQVSGNPVQPQPARSWKPASVNNTHWSHSSGESSYQASAWHDQRRFSVTPAAPKSIYVSPVRPATVNVSNYQFQMLARIIHAEAKGEPFKGQVAVGAVILNRIESGKFPDNIASNVLKPGQFEPVANGQIWSRPNASAYRAARLALRGWDPTYGALYFYNPAKVKSRWIWSRTVQMRIGDHVFAT